MEGAWTYKNPFNTGEWGRSPRHQLAVIWNVFKFEDCTVCSEEQVPQFGSRSLSCLAQSHSGLARHLGRDD